VTDTQQLPNRWNSLRHNLRTGTTSSPLSQNLRAGRRRSRRGRDFLRWWPSRRQKGCTNLPQEVGEEAEKGLPIATYMVIRPRYRHNGVCRMKTKRQPAVLRTKHTTAAEPATRAAQAMVMVAITPASSIWSRVRRRSRNAPLQMNRVTSTSAAVHREHTTVVRFSLPSLSFVERYRSQPQRRCRVAGPD
jgi:hypothetical protein